MSQFELRPATPEDEAFVDDLTRQVMTGYARKTWQRGNLVAEYFKGHPYEWRNTQIIQQDGRDVGRVSLVKTGRDVLIDGIHLLPDYQSRGIGTQIIQKIIDETNAKGLVTKLQVLRVNPAVELYERLGFEIVKENATHYFMETAPTANARVTVEMKADDATIFAALLSPKAIGDWMFGPKLREEEIVSLEVDPKVGGEFAFVVKRGGERIDHVGQYLEIEAPHRLAFTWGVKQDESESRVVITIEKGEVTLVHELPMDWASFVDRAAESWRKMLLVLKAGVESALY